MPTHRDTITGPVGRSPDFIHELGLYGSDEEFWALIGPFALGGLDNDEPLVFAYDDHKVRLLRERLPDSPTITYVTDTGPYATPTRALAAWRHVVEERLNDGARRVRIAGDVPHEGHGRSYAGWDRYEAAVDRALGDLPVWAPCLYDVRIAPPQVVATAKRLHRGFLEPHGGHRVNRGFGGPPRFADFHRPPADAVELTPPAAVLVDPTPAATRAAVRRLADGILERGQTDELVLAASEAVANALLHGKPPVQVRLWPHDAGLLVQVHDQGRGPSDPLVGLLPGPGDGSPASGLGMWVVHNLDIDVALVVAANGFTVRLRADRTPRAA